VCGEVSETVRSLQLQAALTEFTEQAAARLHADVFAGHEVSFELASHSGRGRGSAPLYCYSPLTGLFIAERFPELRRLDGYPAAAELLDSFDALDRYLISSGGAPARRGARGRADAALLVLLKEVFEEQTDFELRPERLDRALERLDGSAFAATGEVTLVATLHGLTIASPELALARGLLIAQPDALRGVPEQAVCAEVGGADHLLVVFSAESPEPHTAINQGEEVVRELLRALRLFGDGRIALGSCAWVRIGSAPWGTVALDAGGCPHGMLIVTVEQEDELRAFCNLVSRRAPHANEIAWALRRFELGCERAAEYEGLSDHLLALRALLGAPSELEPQGAPDGLLVGRLAALCATPDERSALAERALAAIALERKVIAGKAIERAAELALARDLSNHLRALLRDVICNHLPSDLASLADELLLSDGELVEQQGRSSGERVLGGELVEQQGRSSGERVLGGELVEQQGRSSGERVLGGELVEQQACSSGEQVLGGELVEQQACSSGEQVLGGELEEQQACSSGEQVLGGELEEQQACSSGEQVLGNDSQSAEVLHVAV
jgi:hypothetical protein